MSRFAFDCYVSNLSEEEGGLVPFQVTFQHALEIKSSVGECAFVNARLLLPRFHVAGFVRLLLYLISPSFQPLFVLGVRFVTLTSPGSNPFSSNDTMDNREVPVQGAGTGYCAVASTVCSSHAREVLMATEWTCHR